MYMPNTLVYYDTATIMTVKSVILQAHGAYLCRSPWKVPALLSNNRQSLKVSPGKNTLA